MNINFLTDPVGFYVPTICCNWLFNCNNIYRVTQKNLNDFSKMGVASK